MQALIQSGVSSLWEVEVLFKMGCGESASHHETCFVKSTSMDMGRSAWELTRGLSGSKTSDVAS